MRGFRDERGVAMITVLFVAAVLTVVASTAAFVTVQEFRSSADDRRAGRALSTAEAGVDRMMLWIRSFRLPWKELVLSGCTFGGTSYPTQGPGSTLSPPIITLTGTVGAGETYSATLRPHGVCPTTTVPSPKNPFEMDITSTGSIPTATRVVRQQITLQGKDFPIGIRATTLIDANGNPSFQGATVISSGPILGRNKMAFSGIDPWYEKSDFYSCGSNHPAPFTFVCVPEDGDDIGDMPAAAHSADQLYLNAGSAEHPPNPNCTANRGIAAQSVWDGDINGVPFSSGCTDQYGRPPTSRFTSQDVSRLTSSPRLSPDDHVYFKDVAQTAGLYCDFRTNPNNQCTKFQSATGTVIPVNVGGDVTNTTVSGIGNYYLIYIEYAAGSDPFTNVIDWSATLPPCSTANPASNSLAVVVIRNGSLRFRDGARLTGAIFAEDGRVDAAGGYTVEGTVIAKEFRLRGNPTYIMNQCWLDLFPGPFMTVTAGRWTEVDR